MEIKTDHILKALQVVAWIIFVGACVEAGGFLFNTLLMLLLPHQRGKFWKEVDLNALYDYNQSHFVYIASLMVIAAVLKAILFYLIIKIFHDKNFNPLHPFNEGVKRFFANLAYLSLGIGLFSNWGAGLAKNIRAMGVALPDTQALRLGGADVWLLMGVILLIISVVFKKGIELQNESDLTV